MDSWDDGQCMHRRLRGSGCQEWPCGDGPADWQPACGTCDSTDQVAWAAAFEAWLCFACRTKRTWGLLDGAVPVPDGGPRPAQVRLLPGCDCDWPPGNPFTPHRPWCALARAAGHTR